VDELLTFPTQLGLASPQSHLENRARPRRRSAPLELRAASRFRRNLTLALAQALAACSSGTVTPNTNTTGTAQEADAGETPPASADGGASTALAGRLGKLGDAKPTVSSLFISNSGETLIYLSSAAITCAQLSSSRWLGSVSSGAQVVEIVVKGTPATGKVAVPPGEVNYAEGGKSSAYEVNAVSGTITFTKFEPKAVVEGLVSASYGGADSIRGTFHAEFCDGGQGY
jgi:hypothetical protein